MCNSPFDQTPFRRDMKRQCAIHIQFFNKKKEKKRKKCNGNSNCHLYKTTKLRIGNRAYHAELAKSMDPTARGQGLELTAYCPRL